jgi:hypothetical protein
LREKVAANMRSEYEIVVDMSIHDLEKLAAVRVAICGVLVCAGYVSGKKLLKATFRA